MARLLRWLCSLVLVLISLALVQAASVVPLVRSPLVTSDGDGMDDTGNIPQITYTIFQSNYAGWEKRVYHDNGRPVLTNVMLRKNATHADKSMFNDLKHLANLDNTPVRSTGVVTDVPEHLHVPNSEGAQEGNEGAQQNALYLPLVLVLPPPPQPTISYYMQTRDQNTITDMGCVQGTQDRLSRYPHNSVVILMFGEPAWDDVDGTRRYGAYDYTDEFIGSEQIQEEVLWFAEGYLRCELDGDSRLTLAIGTSNDGSEFAQEPREFGRQWAQMLNALQDDFETRSVNGTLISDQVNAQGASDMELNWGTSSNTRAWVDGYLEDNDRLLYNFGDAAGCPPGGTCNNGWTQEDIWYISSHGGAIPQIYSEAAVSTVTNGDQWYHISLDAVDATPARPPVHFRGSLTQYGACEQDPQNCPAGTRNTPREGWRQLWWNLRRDSRTEQVPVWSTDIRDSPE